MTQLEALQIVLDLASQNVIVDFTTRDSELEEEHDRQEDAIEIVSKMIEEMKG